MSYLVLKSHIQRDKSLWVKEKTTTKNPDRIWCAGGYAKVIAFCRTRKDGEEFIAKLNEKLKINN
jgi:hypothetical protein